MEGFGGHELAAGFTIRRENIPAFRRRINRCVSEYVGGVAPVSSLEVDVVLRRPELISLREVDALSALEPYGAGNGRPVFCFLGAKLENMQPVGQNIAAPILTGSCSVYGKVIGDVTLTGTAVVISGEEILNESLDTLIINDRGRTIIRAPSRDELAPCQPQEKQKKPKNKGRDR